MRAAIRWSTYVLPVVVVVLVGEVHAHLIGHYSFTGTFRFGWVIGYLVILWVSGYAVGLPDVPRTSGGAAVAAAAAVLLAAGVISLLQLVSGSALLPRFVVFGAAVALLPGYTGLTLASERIRQHEEGADRVLAVVTGEEVDALRRDLAGAPERPGSLVAVLSVEEAAPVAIVPPASWKVDGEGMEDCGPEPRLPLVDRARAERATVVVLDRQAQSDDRIVTQVALLHSRGVRVRTLSLFYDEWLGKLPVAELERISLMFDIQEVHAQRYARLKRFLDLVVAAVGLVVFALSVPLVSFLDLVGNPGPLLYRQPRVGKDGVEFTIVKFRSMPPDAGEAQWTGEDDPRLLPVGRWMRRVHLDELPQVLNILRGDLSLVGPRPEQPRYVEQLRTEIPFYDVRHLVHPGLTGWAQVKYQYGASVGDALEKLQYEFFYLRHQSLALDLRIVARTLRHLFARQGR